VKGYSSVEDCIKLSSDYWVRAAARRVFLYVDRVESKSNVSDEPSRLKTDGLMHELGAVFDEPNLSYLDSHAPDRDPCRWFGNKASWAQTVASLHAEIYPTSTQPGLGTFLKETPALLDPREDRRRRKVTDDSHRKVK